MARPSSKLQAKRMFAILNILQENAHVGIDSLASLLEITPAEVERIVEKLACCGLDDFLLVPIYIEDGEVHITDDLPALSRPLRLSSSEATALGAALKRADVSEDDPLNQKLLEAAVTPAFDRDRLQSMRFQSEEFGLGEHLKKLAYAIEARLLTRISYRKQEDEEASERIIEPLQLLLEGEAWYLRAWCRQADDLRVFRADRIKEVSVSRTRFAQRDFEPTWHVMPFSGLPLARVALDGSIDPFSLHWPGLTVVERQKRRTVVELPYSGTEWISTQVVSLLGKAEVLAPVELREVVRGKVDRIREDIAP